MTGKEYVNVVYGKIQKKNYVCILCSPGKSVSHGVIFSKVQTVCIVELSSWVHVLKIKEPGLYYQRTSYKPPRRGYLALCSVGKEPEIFTLIHLQMDTVIDTAPCGCTSEDIDKYYLWDEIEAVML